MPFLFEKLVVYQKSLDFAESIAALTDGLRLSKPIPTCRGAVMAGMRNRLIHAYYDVDLDRVWDTVSVDLPPLVEGLKRALEAN